MASNGVQTATTTRWVIPATIDLHNWLEIHASDLTTGYLTILGTRAVDSATEAIYRHLVHNLPVDVPLSIGASMVSEHAGYGQDLDEITVQAWRHPDGMWAVQLDSNSPTVHETFAALDGPLPHPTGTPTGDLWWDTLDLNRPWLTWHPHPTTGQITWAALCVLRAGAYTPWATEEVEDILRFEALNAAVTTLATERSGGDETMTAAHADELNRVLWTPVDTTEDAATTPSGLLDPSWGELDTVVTATAPHVHLTNAELAGDTPVRFDHTTLAPVLDAARAAVADRWARACRNGR